MAYAYKKIKLKDGTTRDEHRLVMEKKLGRALLTTEIIHHKDGNKRNDEPSNLEITDRSSHMSHHIRCGDIPTGNNMTPKGAASITVKLSKLTTDEAIRVKYGKEKGSVLCKELGVSRNIISHIRTGKSWKHI